jgi:predicted phage baseplate assembly protein
VARGNMIPTDHGVWQDWEDLGDVAPAPPSPVTAAACTCGAQDLSAAPLPRYYPQLSNSPLTFAVPLDTSVPASSFLAPPASPVPLLHVRDNRLDPWTVLGDLLASTSTDPVVVPEIESDGTVFLRFGDNEHGLAADAATSFEARYRIGNGSFGNIAHDSLAHIGTSVDGIVKVCNPLPATGGRDPETMEHIRQRAPFAFRTQLRAVTEDDYGEVAQRDPAIREARGTLRWTGSWYTASVSADPLDGNVQPSRVLAAKTLQRLDPMRMAGVDLEVEPAIVTGLRIEMNICVDRGHFQSDVRAAILRVFTAGDQCSGLRGILNPENFTFGETIYTSPLIAAAQAVDGVASVTLSVFQRMDDPTFDGAAQGFLTMHRLEIARCDNDPGRLDRGIFVLHMDGGK